MKYKIAIVSNTSWYLYNFRLNIMKAFKDKGFEVIAIAPKDNYSLRLIENGFDSFYEIKLNNKGLNPFEEAQALYHFYKIYKETKPNIILHFTPKPNIYGTIAAKRLYIPVINNIAGLGALFINQSFITYVVKILYRYSQKKATKVFFQNKDDLALFLNQNIIKSHQCGLLPGSGVDIQKYTPEMLEKTDKPFRFILIARMLWDKGIAEYVEAAKIIKSKYRQIEFQLLGFLDVQNPTAITRDKMNEWVKNGTVIYLGTSDNVKDFLANVDCVVLPSYREGTPRSLLEAAAMAKPIITTNAVGCKEVVDDGENGFLCEVKSSTDLARKMEKMIKLSEKERMEMGRQGREKMIREFDERIVIQKYLDVVNQIIEVSK